MIIVKDRGDSGQADLQCCFSESTKWIEKQGKEANEVCSWHMPGSSRSGIKPFKARQATAWLTTGLARRPISAETGCFKTSHPGRVVNEVSHRYVLKAASLLGELILVPFSLQSGIASCFWVFLEEGKPICGCVPVQTSLLSSCSWDFIIKKLVIFLHSWN